MILESEGTPSFSLWWRVPRPLAFDALGADISYTHLTHKKKTSKSVVAYCKLSRWSHNFFYEVWPRSNESDYKRSLIGSEGCKSQYVIFYVISFVRISSAECATSCRVCGNRSVVLSAGDCFFLYRLVGVRYFFAIYGKKRRFYLLHLSKKIIDIPVTTFQLKLLRQIATFQLKLHEWVY